MTYAGGHVLNPVTADEKPTRYLLYFFASIMVALALFIFYLLSSWAPVTPPTTTANDARIVPSVNNPRPTLRPSKISKKPITPRYTWHHINVARGDNISTLFARLQLSAKQLQQLLISPAVKNRLATLSPGDKLDIAIDKAGQVTLLRYQYALNQALSLKLMNGHYQAKTLSTDLATSIHHARGTIQHSLAATTNTMGLPAKVMLQLAHIFAWQLDFNRDLRAGDEINLLYETQNLHGKLVQTGDIVAAQLITHKKTLTALRYTNQHGEQDYYTPKGQSLSKAFTRYPLHFSYISSSFSRKGRYHPILHVVRPHLGVDLAAPYRTPIKSVADGRVQFIGWQHGYGRVMIIDHGRGYSTLYAHMSGFNKHLHRLSQVKRGQLIGFVGESGLATGPHCHFEFRKNGVHYNPVTVKLPAKRAINAREHQAFFQHATSLLTALHSTPTHQPR